MGHMIDIRLILSDIDGTLAVDSSTVSPGNIHWIRRAVLEKHVPFAIVSGRLPGGVRPLAEQIGVPIVICAANGQYIEYKGQVLKCVTLPVSTAKRILSVARRNGVDICIFTRDSWYVQKGSYLYDVQAKLYGFSGHEVDQEEFLDQCEREGGPDIMKCLPKDPAHPERMPKLYDDLKKEFGDDLFLSSSSPTIIETGPKGTGKSHVVSFLAEKFGISPSQVMAFGDWSNDLGMLRAAGISVAMGNANDAVKAVCRYRTDTCLNDGVGKGIARYLFGEKV